MNPERVCIIGGGVVGLTTALALQDRLPNASYTVIAEKFNTETTSDGAAGLFYPFSSFKARTFEMAREIIKDSYDYYEDLRKTYGSHATGITETTGYILSNISSEEVESPLIEGTVPEYRLLSPEEVAECPGNWKYGLYIKTLLISNRLFLPWAMGRYQSRGGKFIQKKLMSFKELIPYKFDLIFNCTGLGARNLCQDDELVPVQGQVIKVFAPWVEQFYLVDDCIYVIPGFETTLGGCKKFNEYSVSVDKDMSEHIWKKCTELVPSLKECAVIRDWVGLRPHRSPIRLEPELLDIDGYRLKIIHNYGHGSQGVTVAPGCARYCLQYALDLIGRD